MSLRLPSLLLLLLATAAIAVGCGGPLGKAEYQKQVESIGCDAEDELNEAIPSSNTAPSEDNLDDAQEVFAKAADDLDELSPPTEVEKAHALMVKGLRELSRTFGELADEVGKADTDAKRRDVFLKAASDPDAKKAFDDLSKAQQQFKQENYTVFEGDSQFSCGKKQPAGGTTTTD